MHGRAQGLGDDSAPAGRTPHAGVDRRPATQAASQRAWVDWAIGQVDADANRSADTHLHRFPLPPDWGIELYLKDESVHPTGSLKHRLARSLVLHGLCSGWITSDTMLVEASSGSTAVSEAYFARLLGLRFVAVMPANTVQEKCDLIRFYGGECHLVDDPTMIYTVAAELADCADGHYLDQFTFAERATDWRGNNNIAESIVSQMAREPHPVPEWVVTGAGTGGTSATIGRYLRYCKLGSRLCVVDPENSAFYPAWRADDAGVTAKGSRIEGIGRPRVEPSFVGSLIDRMILVPDGASLAAMRSTSQTLGRMAGGSTGTNMWGSFALIAEMLAAGRTGSLVTLLCDDGRRYAHTYYDDAWVADQGLDLEPYQHTIDTFLASGSWNPPD